MNYKHLFAIHRQLLKRDIPDDLMPVFFEYLGDLNETLDDLTNQNCWYKITYDDIDYIRNQQDKLVKMWQRRHGGHYCLVCKKVYDIRATWEFKQHCRGKVHTRNLKKDDNFDPPTKKEIINAMKQKYTHFYFHVLQSRERSKPKRQIKSLLVEKINPFK